MGARSDYSEDGMIQRDAAAVLAWLGRASVHAQAETAKAKNGNRPFRDPARPMLL